MWKKLGFSRLTGAPAANDDVAGAFDFLELVREWPTLVGRTLGDNSVPMRLKNGTLFILTRHPVFSQELSYLATPLLGKVSQRFPRLGPQLHKLAFETNESFFISHHAKVAEKPAAAAPHPFDPAYRRLKSEAEALFRDVEDPKEKERWISLYVQSAQAQDPHRP